MDDQQRARRLSRLGYDHLRDGAWFEAVKVGHALRLLRHPAGFELEALGLSGMDQGAEAVATLEEGVRESPGTWELWDLLGVLRGEAGDTLGAHDAFDEALFCPEPDQPLIHLHAAVVLRVEGRAEEALRRLDLAEGARPATRVAALRAGLLLELGRTAEALASATAAATELERGSDPEDAAERAALAELFAVQAAALWRVGGGVDAAIDCARRALGLDEENGTARVVLRRLLGGRGHLRADALPVWTGR